MAIWGVYIVESQSTGHLFTGTTTRIAWRLHILNNGSGAKLVKGKGPWSLAFWEVVGSQEKAAQREAEVKAMSKAQKLALIKDRAKP